MFAGIVETIGTVTACGAQSLTVRPAKPLRRLSIGESISVDGVCLTVDRRTGGTISFRLLPETKRVTTLGALRIGKEVNLERALQIGDRMGGHPLLGHVDGQGTIMRRLGKGETFTLELQVPPVLASCLVPKGPIALDGVSLTLDPKIGPNRLSVHLIPHTARVTTLGKKGVGERVNIELDLVAKYLRGML